MEIIVKEPAPKYRSVSPDEYLEMDQAIRERLEYYSGQIVQLDAVTDIHDTIQSNIRTHLWSFLKGQTSRLMGSKMRIGTPSRKYYMYADAMIIRGKFKLEETRDDIVINPSVIIEIQSPSIGGINKKRKLDFYKEIPSLREYIIVDSQKYKVEIARKRSQGDWPVAEVNDRNGILFIESIEYELTLPEIYKDTGL